MSVSVDTAMSILILSSIFACAVAAPSGGLIAPIAQIPIAPVPLPAIPIPAIKTIPLVGAIPVAAPTISPGDIQAAAINAQVEAEDRLRAAAEKNREINEQTLKEQADKIVETSNLNSEKNQEAFWDVEDKKWQTLNALQTAQAKFEGLVASNAELLGQSVLKPLIAPGVPIAYGLPYPNTPLISAVAIKEGEKQENTEVKAEEAKPQELKSDVQDSVQIEAADSNEQVAVRTPAAVAENEEKAAAAANAQAAANAELKAANAEAKLKEGGVAPVVANIGFPIYAPIAGVPVNLNEVGWQAAFIPPGIKILTQI